MKTSTLSTATARKRVYQAFWQDGTLDLAIGLGLAVIGLGWLAGLVAIAAATPAIIVPCWSAARTRLIEPRLGYARFDEPRRRQMKRGQVALIAIGVGIFGAIVVTFLIARPRLVEADLAHLLIPALPAALVGLGGLVAALLFQMPRLLAYGGFALVAGLAGGALDLEPGWTLLAAGLAPLATGGLLLALFLRSFPVLPSEME